MADEGVVSELIKLRRDVDELAKQASASDESIVALRGHLVDLTNDVRTMERSIRDVFGYHQSRPMVALYQGLLDGATERASQYTTQAKLIAELLKQMEEYIAAADEAKTRAEG